MPRGVYDRKPREESAAAIATPNTQVEMPQAPCAPVYVRLTRQGQPMLCSTCAAFDSSRETGPTGLCRLYPDAVWMTGDGWCMQWSGRGP